MRRHTQEDFNYTGVRIPCAYLFLLNNQPGSQK